MMGYENIDVVRNHFARLDAIYNTKYLEAFETLVESTGKKDALVRKNWRTTKDFDKYRVVYEDLNVSQRGIQSFINRVVYNLSKDNSTENIPIYVRAKIFVWSKQKYGWYFVHITLENYNSKWFTTATHNNQETEIVDGLSKD